jgi:Matrixin
VTRRYRIAAIVLLVIVFGVPTAAYLKLGTPVGGRTVTLEWRQFPIRYFVTNRDVDGVTAQQLSTAVQRAFLTWQGVPNTQTSSTFVGFTQADPSSGDGETVLGFQNRPELDRTLAATDFVIDSTTGEIVDSDIFFNSAFIWSTADAGVSGRFDVESIALHEIGHLFGLSHSALGETELRGGGRGVLGAEAVMFPIAFSAGDITGRRLRADDVAGLSDIYGNQSFQRQTGSVSGKVTKNGRGVLGAHVVAFNPASGKLVGGFSLSDDGAFVIAGLEPGPQVLRAEPLDDGDLSSFFATMNVDIDFQVKFSDNVVVVPRGGGTRNIEIKVLPK